MYVIELVFDINVSCEYALARNAMSPAISDMLDCCRTCQPVETRGFSVHVLLASSYQRPPISRLEKFSEAEFGIYINLRMFTYATLYSLQHLSTVYLQTCALQHLLIADCSM